VAAHFRQQPSNTLAKLLTQTDEIAKVERICDEIRGRTANHTGYGADLTATDEEHWAKCLRRNLKFLATSPARKSRVHDQ